MSNIAILKDHDGKILDVSELAALLSSINEIKHLVKDGILTRTPGTTGSLRYRVTLDGALTDAICDSLTSSTKVTIPDLTPAIETHDDLKDLYKEVDRIKKTHTVIRKPVDSRDVKILCLSDLHIPFQHDKLIQAALDEHGDADVLVLNGDILDAYAASSYSKDKLISIMEEYKQAMMFLFKVSKLFPKVVVTKGNHEDRCDRFFSKKVDPDMVMLSQKDILWRLCSGHIYDCEGSLVGQLKMDNVHYNESGIPWIAQVGKTLFFHPSSYSSAPAGTVVSCLKHLEPYYTNDKYDSIVVGHTHKQAKLIEKDKLLIEQGCMCSSMDYIKQGSLTTRPSVLGYAVIYQDSKGNTDYNRSGYVYCGSLNQQA